MTDANPLSILDSVKKVLGFDPDYTFFDLDITMHINAAFGGLRLLGVGGDNGFMIADNSTIWAQYTQQLSYLALVQQYICLTVKLAFDPPATSFALDAYQKQIERVSWLLNVSAEQINPPSNPFGTIEESDDGVAYFKVQVVEVPFQSVITLDASEGNVFRLTITGNCTVDAPINGVDGEHITLEVTSDGATITWGAGWNFGASGEPALSGTNKTDIISGYYRQTDADWPAGFTPGF